MIGNSPSQKAGREAEASARAHLEQHGLRLLAQNWTCRRGELDLVMLDGDTVVFVEVRSRRHSAWGGALESVDWRKRERLTISAELFLQQNARWNNHACRFDIVAIDARTPGSAGRLNWIPNAFDT